MNGETSTIHDTNATPSEKQSEIDPQGFMVIQSTRQYKSI